jgi:hypothetical protein
LIDALERLELPPATRAIVDGIAADHERAMRDARDRIVEDTLARLKSVLPLDDYAQVEREARRPPPRPPPPPKQKR